MVLASIWTHSESADICYDRYDPTCRQYGRHRPITWGTGGASPAVPTIRCVRLTNQGKEVLRFSKIGLYLQLTDATSDRADWLERNKASVQFYTNGLAGCKGDMIDMTTPTPQSYATVSREHYVALPADTSLVLDLKADVPIAAVRLGAVESTTQPAQLKLLVETSARHSDIADATFTSGFVRRAAIVQASGPPFYAFPRTAGMIARFQSASDVVDAGNLGTMGSAYTIECRFQSVSVTSYRNLCDMNYSVSNVGPRFEQTNSKNAYWVWSANGSNFSVSAPIPLVENAWYHMAFVLNNGRVSMYLNGAPVASDVPSKNGFPTAFGSAWIGGGFSTDRHFQGAISMLNVYKTALTAAEVRSSAAVAMQQPPSGASAPTSHIGKSGIYEYAATSTGFTTVAPAPTPASSPPPAARVVVKSIYATNATGTAKTGGYNPDPFASALVVALPFDSHADVSAEINPDTYAKRISPKSGSTIQTTTAAKFYGMTRSSVNGTSSVLVTNMPSSYLSGDFTFEAWVYPNGARNGWAIFGSEPYERGVTCVMDGSTLFLRVSNGRIGNIINTTVANPIPNQKWSHFAMTKSGGTYSVYVNGTSRMTATNATTLAGYSTTLNVGGNRLAATTGRDENDDFGGYMNDVRVYTACKYTAPFSIVP
jgi:hypothetical protein